MCNFVDKMSKNEEKRVNRQKSTTHGKAHTNKEISLSYNACKHVIEGNGEINTVHFEEKNKIKLI